MEKELLEHIGFEKNDGKYPEGDYTDMMKKYGVHELENEHEMQLNEEYGLVFPQELSLPPALSGI